MSYIFSFSFCYLLPVMDPAMLFVVALNICLLCFAESSEDTQVG